MSGDEDSPKKRRGVRASDLGALTKDAGPHSQRIIAEWRDQQQREREDFLAVLRVETKREARRLAAESATIDTPALISALVDLSEQQASRLAVLEREMKEGSRTQRRMMWLTGVATLAAVVAAVGGLL